VIVLKNSDLQSGYVKRGQSFFLLSFGFLILVGTALLKIPGMYGEGTLEWVDALFMATSSVCVTGLTVKPVADFSFAGQLVIMLLIQTGGLGIMTLSASILLALGRGLSFGNSLMISNLNDKFSLRGTESLLRTVMIYTFAAEAVGWAAILPGILLSGYGVWEGLWYSCFLSVSSFCNAGMTTFHNSLIGIHRSAQIAGAVLAITGGLGIYVIYDIIQVARRKQNRFRVHSKLVLMTTGILLVAGMAGLWVFGWGTGQSIGWVDAFFFAVTSRTCGWYTFPVAELPHISLTLIMLLMLVGGSPGSTAGGIKTSTVALALAAIVSTLRGDPETLVFKRRIPTLNVLRSFTIILLFTLLGCAGALALGLMEPALDLTDTAFEAISALTTTGLSVGNTTALLSDKGKLLLVLFMFLGRVGPFTVLLFLLGREKPGQLKYPEERVIIG
jgi:trk system potassium uptake protein TrkH